MQMQPPAMPAPGMYYGRGYPPQPAYGVPPMQGKLATLLPEREGWLTRRADPYGAPAPAGYGYPPQGQPQQGPPNGSY